jgi:hypothetical protein
MKLKAQMNMIGLVMGFLTLVVASKLIPMTIPIIANVTATAGMDDASIMIWNLMPFTMVISVLLSILVYAIPQRQ